MQNVQTSPSPSQNPRTRSAGLSLWPQLLDSKGLNCQLSHVFPAAPTAEVSVMDDDDLLASFRTRSTHYVAKPLSDGRFVQWRKNNFEGLVNFDVWRELEVQWTKCKNPVHLHWVDMLQTLATLKPKNLSQQRVVYQTEFASQFVLSTRHKI